MKNILFLGVAFILLNQKISASQEIVEGYEPKKEMYERLEAKLSALPVYSNEECDRFERDVLNMECSKRTDYESFGRINFDAPSKKYSAKLIPPREGDIPGRLKGVISYLEKITFENPSNFSFFIAVGDQASLPKELGDEIHRVPFLCSDRKPAASGLQDAFVMPDFYLLGDNHKSTISQIQKAVTENKGKAKLDVAGWRGSQTGGRFSMSAIGKLPRLNLVMYSKDHPDYVDAGFINYDCQLAGGEEGQKYKEFMMKEFGPPAPYVPFPQMVQYKYNVSLDGNVSAWARVPWILFTKTILLFNTNFETFYTPFFKENVHYIPIKPDMSDIGAKIDELRQDPELYDRISENGLKFAEEIFTPEAIQAYYETVLTRIAGNFVTAQR